MSVSLFRRWRSQKFSDLVGQESVVSTLQNVLRGGDPARAYLFCGPRGTGKTSSARIFAKALNCENGPTEEPCNQCSQCRSIADGSNLDVFEIDAASHTQVDKIRDFIVEKVHFTPVAARFKVYIIDEVHKLSTSSFNALLKTLEEPPSHVVFVLATTHPHEMPSTILSRCQRYDFRPLTATETERHIKMIAGEESIDLEEDAARHLARAADGSLRDALVLFEQAHVFSEGQVTRDKVLDLLGGVGYEVLEEMFTDLHGGQAAAALERLDDWIVRGRDLKRLAESFQDHLRMLLLIRVRSEDQSIRHLSEEERASLERLAGLMSVGAITQWLRSVGEMLGQIRHGRRARLEWEMLLVSLAHPESDPSLDGLQRRLERLESGGVPTSASEGGVATVPADLLARLEAAERAGKRLASSVQKLQESEPAKNAVTPAPDLPKGFVARFEALEKRAESSGSEPSVDDSRVQALERELAKMTHTFDSRLEALEELEKQVATLRSGLKSGTSNPEIPSSAAAPKPKAEKPSQPPAKKEEPPVAAPSPAPVSPGPLDRDVVDDWLVMPKVLVTGRIDRSGQTSLLDSFEEIEPEPPMPSYGEASSEDNYRAEPTQEEAPAVPEKEPVPEPSRAPEPRPEPVRQAPPERVQPSEPPRPTKPDPVRRSEPEPKAAPEPPRAQEAPKAPEAPKPPKEEPVSTAPAPQAAPAQPLPDPKEFFRLLMQQVKENDIRLHAVLADARLTALEPGRFELAVPAGYDWHFGRIQEGRGLLESVAAKLASGQTLQMECSIGGEKAAPPKENEHEELVKRASGVFGGSSIVD